MPTAAKSESNRGCSFWNSMVIHKPNMTQNISLLSIGCTILLCCAMLCCAVLNFTTYLLNPFRHLRDSMAKFSSLSTVKVTQSLCLLVTLQPLYLDSYKCIPVLGTIMYHTDVTCAFNFEDTGAIG